jgi:hypothetical protein
MEIVGFITAEYNFDFFFREVLRRPMNRACGALFTFSRLLITVKFQRVPTPSNSAPIATFTRDYCGFEFLNETALRR